MKDADLKILKAELTNDPIARGYSAIKDHEQIAATFRVKDREADVDVLDTGLLAASISATEFGVLLASPAKAEYLKLLVSAQRVPLIPNVKQELRELFPPGTEARKTLNRLLKREGTRAEELGIPLPTASNIADALLRTA